MRGVDDENHSDGLLKKNQYYVIPLFEPACSSTTRVLFKISSNLSDVVRDFNLSKNVLNLGFWIERYEGHRKKKVLSRQVSKLFLIIFCSGR
jgi:hypothetical protein